MSNENVVSNETQLDGKKVIAEKVLLNINYNILKCF